MRALLLLAAAPLVLPANDPAWLEIAPNQHVLARTIVKSACPSIEVDGKTSAMPLRKGVPHLAQHRLVCELDVTSASKVSIGGVAMKMPKKDPGHILVIGD